MKDDILEIIEEWMEEYGADINGHARLISNESADELAQQIADRYENEDADK